MSRRNGSQQTWGEFSGTVKINDSAGVQADAISIGSIIDSVRDLGLSDMLSASSLGSYSCLVRATAKGVTGVGFAVMPKVELAIMNNYPGVMIIEKGSSQLLS